MFDFISPVIGWIPNYVIDPLIAKFRVIKDLRKNIGELKSAEERLEGRNKAEREKLENKKRQEGVDPSPDAQRWFTQAAEAVSDANSLRTKYLLERQSRGGGGGGACSDWFCFLSRYRLSKEALYLKVRVDELHDEDPKAGWTAASTQQKGKQLNTVSMEGQITREKLKDEIIEAVLGDEYLFVGLHGMGGIGKTTLLKNVYNHFTNTGGFFESVIFTTLSATPNFREMRKQIAKGFRLNVNDSTDDDNDVKQKLYRQTDKYLLILDDMWESKPQQIDLNEICISAPTKDNGCKIIMASRSLKVITKFVIEFAGSDSLHTIPVDKLPPNEAWDLFVKKVGETPIRSQPGVKNLAEQIVRKCDGMPLAITVVAGTMSTRKSQGEWRDALREMGRLSEAINLEDFQEKVFAILNFSFEKLSEDEKSLFLYCCLFPEDKLIYRRDLYKYGIGEEALWDKMLKRDKMLKLEDMKDKVDVLIRDLQNSSMLEDASMLDYMGNKPVKVHDVLREFGLWIKYPKIIANAADRVSEWSKATKISLYSDESLPQLSDDCLHLHTLLLPCQYSFSNLMDIPQSHFLEHMPALKMLYLNIFRKIRNLPPSISHLVNLRSLSLHMCTSLEELPPEIGMLAQLISLDLACCDSLKGLPVEMKELKNLRHLDIFRTGSLKRIPSGLLSELHKLEEFDNTASKWKLSTSDIMELCKLAHLTCIGINMRKVKVNPQFLKQLAKCFTGRLEMWNCDIDPSVYSNIPETITRGPYRSVSFDSCTGLTRVPTHHDYVYLSVVRCQDLKTLVMVDEEKVDERNNNIIAFQNLGRLELDELHELETICSGRIPLQQTLGPGSSSYLFSNLEELTVKRCPNLKVLFTSGVVPLLLKLEELKVYECSQLEYLIAVDDEDDSDSIINAFPSLWSIELCELPKLTTTCCNNHQHLSDLMKWPSLSKAFVYLCPKLRRPPFGVEHANTPLHDEDNSSKIKNYHVMKEWEEEWRKREEEEEKEDVDDDLQCLD